MLAGSISASRTSMRRGKNRGASRRKGASLPRLRAAAIETLEKRAYLSSSISFSPPSFYSEGEEVTPSAVTSANLGNGHQDLVTADGNGDVSILNGNGDGTFAAPVLVPDGIGSGLEYLITAGPLSAGGSVDLVVADTAGQVAVMTNEGGDAFSVANFTLAFAPTAISLANVGGTEDLLVADTTGSVDVYRNNGDGGLNQTPVVFHTAYNTGGGALVAGDFTNNGSVDIAVTNTTHNTVSILLGNSQGGFTLSDTDYHTGNDPDSIAAVSLTSDGNVDLVTADGDGTITVLPGNGNGTFQSPKSVTVGGNLDGIAAVQVGTLAAVAVTSGTASLKVLSGNGDFSFQAPQPYSVDADAQAVITGDFDTSDPGPDLAVMGSFAYASVLLNSTGSHSFNAPGTFVAGNGDDAVAVADLTNNRTADIVTANYHDGTVSVLMGNGDGTFQAPLTYAVASGPTAVIVADVNGDGIPDIITASAETGTISVLLGHNAGGTFSFLPAIETSVESRFSYFPDSIAAADLSQNGHLDLVVAPGNESIDPFVYILTGNGSGDFTVGSASFSFSLDTDQYYISSVAVGDLNSDGFPDIVATDSDNDEAYVLLNSGDGSFNATGDYSTANDPVAVVLADVNSGGVLDILTADQYGGAVTVILGNGDGTFGASHSFTDYNGFDPVDIAVGDMNGGGVEDILTANSRIEDDPGNTVNILQGNGDGTFKQVGDVIVGNEDYALAVADVNGDNKPDIITANTQDNSVTVVLNTSSANFSKFFGDPGATPTGTGPTSVATAVLAGDSNPSLVVANFTGDSIDVLKGNGNGTFAPGVSYYVNRPTIVLTADLTGDGIPDLIVGSAATDSITVFLGNSNGTFQTPTTTNFSDSGLAITYSVNSMAVGPLAANGTQDLVVADGDGNISVLYGNGAGGFNSHIEFPISMTQTGISSYAVALGDMNNDGTLDVVVTDTQGNEGSRGRVDVLLNNSQGTFNPVSNFFTVGYDPRSVAVGDVNGDGNMDVVVANGSGEGGGSLSVLLGNGKGSLGAAATLTTANFPDQVALDDLYNNGRQDIVVGIPSTGVDATNEHEVQVFVNNGDGVFAPPVALQSGNGPRSLVVADLSGEQSPPDIVTANYYDNTVSVLLNGTPSTASITENAQGTVIALGTSGADLVNVSVANGDLIITINGQTQSFPLSGVHGIEILTGAGNDSLTIGAGVPNLGANTGAGNDVINDQSSGNNTLIGAGGNDSIDGGSGHDILFGGFGTDTVTGGGTDSQLQGNLLSAGDTSQTLQGGAGMDSLVSSTGGDMLNGGPGANFFFDAGTSGNSVNGGLGAFSCAQFNPDSTYQNIFEYINPTNAPGAATAAELAAEESLPADPVTAAPATGVAATATQTGTVVFVYGTSANDTITASSDGVKLYVVVNGSLLAHFRLAGLTGLSVNALGGGNNTITVAPSVTIDSTLRGGVGSDSLTGGGGDNVIIGGAGGDDTLVGGGGTNILIPGDKQSTESAPPEPSDTGDSLVGGTGYTIADFTRRTDALFLSNNGLDDSGDTAMGEEITIATSVNAIWGGSGSDTIIGTAIGMFLSGGSGRTDVLHAEQASDLVVGGTGGANTAEIQAEPVTLDLKNGFADTYGGITDPSVDILDLDTIDVTL